MKHSEFMSAIIRYYGKYENEFIESVILEHVLAIPENELENAMKKLMNNISRNDKYNPVDVAKIKKLFAKNNADIEVEALKWWGMINSNLSYMKDCFIEDIRAQEAIITMGGWVWFCTRMIRDEFGKDIDVWNQKRFVELFKLYTDNPPEAESRVLRGESELAEDKRLRQMILIGDEEKCRMLIESKVKNPALELVEDMTKNLRRML